MLYLWCCWDEEKDDSSVGSKFLPLVIYESKENRDWFDIVYEQVQQRPYNAHRATTRPWQLDEGQLFQAHCGSPIFLWNYGEHLPT